MTGRRHAGMLPAALFLSALAAWAFALSIGASGPVRPARYIDDGRRAGRERKD